MKKAKTPREWMGLFQDLYLLIKADGADPAAYETQFRATRQAFAKYLTSDHATALHPAILQNFCKATQFRLFDARPFSPSKADRKILDFIQQAFDSPQNTDLFARALALAPLFGFAHQFHISTAFDKISPLYLNAYLSYLLQFTPLLYWESGEDERLVGMHHAIMTTVLNKIDGGDPTSVWAFVLQQIATQARTDMWHPTWVHLRDVRTAYAAIVEQFCEWQFGTKTYWTPPKKQTGAKPRFGILLRHDSPNTETLLAMGFGKALRKKFDVHAYIIEPTPAGMRCASSAAFKKEWASAFDAVHDLRSLPINQLVDTLRADSLLIALFATVPVLGTARISYLTYHRVATYQMIASAFCPSTTGAGAVTHVLTDAGTESDAWAMDYSEDPLWLDHHFCCYADDIQHALIGTPELKKQCPEAVRAARKKHKILIGAGTSLVRLTPDLLSAWHKILTTVPDAHMILTPFAPGWGDTSSAKSLLCRKLSALWGGDAWKERFTILPALSPTEVLAVVSQLDLYLDGFPYTGNMAFREPMACGVPVVALRGPHQRGRQGAATLTALGVTETIAGSISDYIDLACALATNPAQRKKIGKKMQAQRSQAPFNDPKSYGTAVVASLAPLIDATP